MTEAEWLASQKPDPMLDFVRYTISDRKARLFAVACCRRIWPLFIDERSRKAVEVAEQFADGIVDEIVRYQAAQEALSLWPADDNTLEYQLAVAAYAAIDDEGDCECYTTVATDSANCAASASEFAVSRSWYGPTQLREWSTQADFLRCVVGLLPFRAPLLSRSWLTPIVNTLAEAIYRDRSFERLPILADALEEAGCTDADILGHCRGPGPHVRGCWVVDLLLGKS